MSAPGCLGVGCDADARTTCDDCQLPLCQECLDEPDQHERDCRVRRVASDRGAIG